MAMIADVTLLFKKKIIETETRKKTAELLGTTCVILLFLKYDKAITYTKLFLEKT